MYPRVKKVEVLNDYKLLLTFTNDEKRIFDVSAYLEDEFWKALKDMNLFKNVKVAGGSIEWDTGEDFCPDELYEKSEKYITDRSNKNE